MCMDFISDILAALGVVLNGIPQGLLALTYGFASVPTALGFILGAVACASLGSIAPISFQAETIALAGNMGKDMRERLSMIVFAGLAMAVLGITGTLTAITDFAGLVVINGMMAGVGIMLVKIAFGMSKENKLVGWISVGVALVTYIIFKTLRSPNALVYTIVISVVVSSVAAKVAKQEIGGNSIIEKAGKLKFHKPIFNLSVLRGALALACLTIGANIAFGGVTGAIGGTNVNIDHLTVYSGLADAVSALFGGGPVEAIISATANAPHAVWAGVIMMVIMAVILFFGLLPKIGKYVPSQSIAGFLLVLGAFATIPGSASAAFAADQNPAVGGVTMVVTAISDPFFGMLAGIALKVIMQLGGLV